MMDVYVESLGCARNQVDSETMTSRLNAAGWRITEDPAAADVIVVNTCSFIESAADQSIDTILALAQFKKTGRCRRLVVAGCLPQRYGSETAAALPEVDVFLGTGAFDQIAAAVAGGLQAGACLLPDPERIDLHHAAGRTPASPHAVYLKIAEGCDRHCTYCIIPRLRGRLRSRPLPAILDEARHLIAGGARELTLVAQESTAYGLELTPPATLAGLLAALAALDHNVWIRFLYAHPDSITPAVWQTIAAHANLCPYFDIPIQHTATPVLRRMGRHYSADDLLRLFDKIRTQLPAAALRTTLLVGFPGERDDDFDHLRAFVERVQFDHLGVFAYSDADDLPAHRLDGHVAQSVARRRMNKLMTRQQAISRRKLARFLGERLTVLVESQLEPGLYAARSMRQAPEVDGTTLVRSAAVLLPGSFIEVRIIDTLDYDLIGEPA
jgi:ribosomal protein S12 methylthiotransferase